MRVRRMTNWSFGKLCNEPAPRLTKGDLIGRATPELINRFWRPGMSFEALKAFIENDVLSQGT